MASFGEIKFTIECDTKEFQCYLKQTKRKLFKLKLKLLIKGVFNMFKSKNRKLIENSQEQIDLLFESIKVERDARMLDFEKSKKQIETLKLQSECGVDHETIGEIKEPEFFYITDSIYGATQAPQLETCKVCGKKLKVFNNSIEADRRKAELLEIEAKKIKDECNELEAEQYLDDNNVIQTKNKKEVK